MKTIGSYLLFKQRNVRLWLRRYSGLCSKEKVPGSSMLYVEVSLSKTLNPELLLVASPSVYEDV